MFKSESYALDLVNHNLFQTSFTSVLCQRHPLRLPNLERWTKKNEKKEEKREMKGEKKKETEGKRRRQRKEMKIFSGCDSQVPKLPCNPRQVITI